jgi:hypothetical protein
VVARVVLSRDGDGGGELPVNMYIAVLKLVCIASALGIASARHLCVAEACECP